MSTLASAETPSAAGSMLRFPTTTHSILQVHIPSGGLSDVSEDRKDTTHLQTSLLPRRRLLSLLLLPSF
ncbi:hypothetical protein E2C01_093666 [Portunus trituberculatus]|uniref:Uncharacterized protein n=1 Tax=Portunus trituberculatus TaxID=210409 RepID=A0A5B7JQE7_PORTR|nr:hypothetical protein [Portunus trituberculatus]